MGADSLFFAYGLPDSGCNDCSDERTYDEHPELCKGVASGKYSRGDGACGVDGGAGVVDAYEAGETREEALKREIREELSTEISVDRFMCMVEYDYLRFHSTMHCFVCSLLNEALHLDEDIVAGC